MARDAQVLDREAVPEADLDEVRKRQGVAVLARDRRPVVIVDAEEIVACGHPVAPVVERQQRVDGTKRAVEGVDARVGLAFHVLRRDRDVRQRAQQRADGAEARRPAGAAFLLGEIVEVAELELRHVAAIGEHGPEIDRGPVVAFFEDMTRAAARRERQLDVHAREIVAQDPAALSEERAHVVAAETEAADQIEAELAEAAPPFALEAGRPHLFPLPRTERRRCERVRGRPCRARVLERERRIHGAGLDAEALQGRAPLAPHEGLDQQRTRARIGIGFELELRARHEPERQRPADLERQVREHEAGVAPRAVAVRIAAVARLPGAAIGPTEIARAVHDARVEEPA